MCKFNPKNDSRFIDPCINSLIRFLQRQGYKTTASCCGHFKYPMTIVIRRMMKDKWENYELLSDTIIPRKTKIYRKDSSGRYFIPEVMEKLKNQ